MFKKPKSIKSIIIPVGFVPETILIKDVLNILTKKRRSIAVVIDEYGGTSGIMTVEDIIEELFWEIEDEHDTVEMIEEQINDSKRWCTNRELQIHDYRSVFNKNRWSRSKNPRCRLTLIKTTLLLLLFTRIYYFRRLIYTKNILYKKDYGSFK